MKSLSKRGYEFSFTWIFTIFVGAAVIFFAIYVATQLIGTQQSSRDVTQGKSLGILLTPIETEIEEGKFATIYLTDPTKMYLECVLPSTSNTFGSQKLGLSIKPPLGNEWGEPDSAPLTFHNKYFFPAADKTDTEDLVISKGEKNFYILSKPFYAPFKVADLMILYGDEKQFCFSNIAQAPREFQNELKRINMTNVFFFPNCDPEKQTIVCFDSINNCDITVIERQNIVTKKGEPQQLVYLESLKHDKYSMLYAAIFSDSDSYRCQTKRLMAHLSQLSALYLEKSNYISTKSFGCTESSKPLLSKLKDKSASASTSGDLTDIKNFMETDPDFTFFKNSAGGICELF